MEAEEDFTPSRIASIRLPLAQAVVSPVLFLPLHSAKYREQQWILRSLLKIPFRQRVDHSMKLTLRLSFVVLASDRSPMSDQLPHPTQRMIRWNPIFQRHITEHPRLQLLIVSSHPCVLPQLHCGIAVVFQQPLRGEE